MVDIRQSYRQIPGSERHPVPGSSQMGLSDPSTPVSVTIHLRRSPTEKPLPDQTHWAGVPPGQRTYPLRAALTQRCSADQAAIDGVIRFAQAEGLQVDRIDPASRLVILRGTIAQMSAAFSVQLYDCEKHGHRYRGREGHLHLPEEIADSVQGVFGLDNRRMSRRSADAGDRNAPTLTPGQIATLYNYPPVPRTIIDQTIGVLQFSDPAVVGSCGYHAADITAYFQSETGIGPSIDPPQLIDVTVAGPGNSPGGVDDVEVTLDIQIAGAVAQGAKIAVYFSTWDENGWLLALKRAVHPGPGDPQPSVISISWMWVEYEALGNLTWSAAAMEAVGETLQEAAAAGITVIAASGDQGSQCQMADGRAHVFYPQSDPWVTTCGGTTVQNISGTSFTETTWNDNGVTGGGVSEHFALPFWQQEAGVPASVNPEGLSGRGLPDIAGYANGYSIFVRGAILPNQSGTSEAAPHYAGLVALINATIDDRIGYLNPWLYTLGGSEIFRDIDDGGSNQRPPAPGYVSGPGWDCCTGWGSLDGTALLKRILALKAEAAAHSQP